MAYVYEPLSDAGETGDFEIRVAVLQPSSSFHAELQIELIVTPLWASVLVIALVPRY